MYLILAIVSYRYAGTDVASPALGSTSALLRKIAYGIAIPTIVYVFPRSNSSLPLHPEPFDVT